jgi:hypothetical protein
MARLCALLRKGKNIMSVKKITCSRFNKVGGQAVLEGVMMKAGDKPLPPAEKRTAHSL